MPAKFVRAGFQRPTLKLHAEGSFGRSERLRAVELRLLRTPWRLKEPVLLLELLFPPSRGLLEFLLRHSEDDLELCVVEVLLPLHRVHVLRDLQLRDEALAEA